MRVRLCIRAEDVRSTRPVLRREVTFLDRHLRSVSNFPLGSYPTDEQRDPILGGVWSSQPKRKQGAYGVHTTS